MDFIKKPSPMLYISDSLYATLLAYARSTDLEMTMVLSIEQTGTYTYEVTKINIPPQWNEAAETKTIDSQYNQWCFEQVKNKIKLNGHLHTHPKMSVCPSGYDENFYTTLINSTNNFQFRLILNQQGNIRVDIIDAVNNYKAENIGITVKAGNLTIFVDATSSPIKSIELPKVEFKPTRRSETDEAYKFNYNHTEDAQRYAYNGIKDLYDYGKTINVTPKQNTSDLVNINEAEVFPTDDSTDRRNYEDYSEVEEETEENKTLAQIADKLANELAVSDLFELITLLEEYL